jgi:hypothetical protein
VENAGLVPVRSLFTSLSRSLYLRLAIAFSISLSISLSRSLSNMTQVFEHELFLLRCPFSPLQVDSGQAVGRGLLWPGGDG